jgi:GNAT superfamily N-acetyltransferase
MRIDPTITRENPASPEASALIAELDAVLEPLYPRESRHGFSVERLIADSVDFFVLRVGEIPAGCGGLKFFGTAYAEIKRMYVRPQFRGLGFARLLLAHLSAHAKTRGVELLRLETGIHQHAAIRVYEQAGFRQIPPFGEYRVDPLSRCYEKAI